MAVNAAATLLQVPLYTVGAVSCTHQPPITGLLASLTAQQAARTVLHQLYIVPALAHALSVSAVHNARPVAIALGNLALEPITHPAMLSTDGLLEGLVGILLWNPSPQELEMVPADVVDACKHDALYALGSLAASPTGALALLEFQDVVPACLAAAAAAATTSDMRHAALQLLQRLSSCGGGVAWQQVAEADGVQVLCGVLNGGCGGGGGCVLCARGVLGVLDVVVFDAQQTQSIAEVCTALYGDLAQRKTHADTLQHITTHIHYNTSQHTDITTHHNTHAGVTQGGGVAAIMRCLGHADGAVQRDAAAVLCRLAAHEGCRGTLLCEPLLVPTLQVQKLPCFSSAAAVGAVGVGVLCDRHPMSEREHQWVAHWGVAVGHC